jgi:hypothetical protein
VNAYEKLNGWTVALLVVATTGCRVAEPTVLNKVDAGIAVGWKVGEYPMGRACFFRYDAEPVDGVEVCFLDDAGNKIDANCVLTDGGTFELQGVPRHSEVLITLEKPASGYGRRLVPLKTNYDDMPYSGDPTWRNPYPGLITPLVKESNRVDAGCPEPEGQNSKGSIVAIALKHNQDNSGAPDLDVEGILSSVSEAQVNIKTEDGGTLTIDGINYYRSDVCGRCPESGFNPYQNTGVELGDGFLTFFNLPPGRYRVRYENLDNYYCVVGGVTEDVLLWGYPTENLKETEIPVRGGFSTISLLRCYPIDRRRVEDAGVEKICRACY